MGNISKRRYKRRNRTSKIWVSLIVLAMVSVFSVRSYALYSQNQEDKEKLAMLEKQKEKEEARAEKLKDEEKYRKTLKYVEDYAHNQLGLVYPDEIIFKSEN